MWHLRTQAPACLHQSQGQVRPALCPGSVATPGLGRLEILGHSARETPEPAQRPHRAPGTTRRPHTSLAGEGLDDGRRPGWMHRNGLGRALRGASQTSGPTFPGDPSAPPGKKGAAACVPGAACGDPRDASCMAHGLLSAGDQNASASRHLQGGTSGGTRQAEGEGAGRVPGAPRARQPAGGTTLSAPCAGLSSGPCRSVPSSNSQGAN